MSVSRNSAAAATAAAAAATAAEVREMASAPVRWLHTAVALAAVLATALSFGIVGPTLLDLSRLTGASIGEISTVFTARGASALAGYFLVDCVLFRVNHHLTVGAALVAMSVLVGVAPLATHLPLLLLTLGPPELLAGAAVAGAQHIIVDTWPTRRTLSLHCLNLTLLLGLMLAPLIAQSFLSSCYTGDAMGGDTEGLNVSAPGHRCVAGNDRNDRDHPAGKQAVGYQADANATHFHGRMAVGFERDGQNATGFWDADHSTNQSQVSGSRSTNVRYAYLIVALYCAVVGLLMLCTFFARERCSWRYHKPEVGQAEPQRDLPLPHCLLWEYRRFARRTRGLFFCLSFLYGGLEVEYTALLLVFAVDFIGWSPGDATWLLVVLHFSRGLATCAAMPLWDLLRPLFVTAVGLATLTFALTLQALCLPRSVPVLWVGVVLVGASFSTVVPASLTFLDSHFRAAEQHRNHTVFWSGYFAGYLTVPTAAGLLYQYVHPLWYLGLPLLCCLTCMLILGLAACSLGSLNRYKKRSLRRRASPWQMLPRTFSEERRIAAKQKQQKQKRPGTSTTGPGTGTRLAAKSTCRAV